MQLVIVAAQIGLIPVERNVRALELRKVHTTCGNNLESIWGGNCRSSSMVLGTGVGTVVGEVHIMLL